MLFSSGAFSLLKLENLADFVGIVQYIYPFFFRCVWQTQFFLGANHTEAILTAQVAGFDFKPLGMMAPTLATTTFCPASTFGAPHTI